jgi:hypothetical protein
MPIHRIGTKIMIKKKEEFVEKNKKDAQITENSFTYAVKKASEGGESSLGEKKKETLKKIRLSQKEEAEKILRANDELMRAKEARNETTIESERFRRDEN